MVRLGSTYQRQGFGTFSYREFLALRGTVRGFDGLTAHQFNTVTFTVGSEPRTEWMELVAANYFDLLGVRVLGRAFLPAEDSVSGGAPVVVISDALWRSGFGADPATVGRTVKLNGHLFTVVGVAPPGFPRAGYRRSIPSLF